MPDKLSEVAKQLGQTKRNAEAAIRRYQAVHPRIERVRDVFDDIIPFEMEFETEPQDGAVNIDLYFNKPPPLRTCNGGRYNLPCEEFELGQGNHLIRVTAKYLPGTIVVFRENVKLTAGQFQEYDPKNGLVYIEGTPSVNIYNICYIRDTWVPLCDPTPLLLRPLNPTLVAPPSSGGLLYEQVRDNLSNEWSTTVFNSSWLDIPDPYPSFSIAGQINIRFTPVFSQDTRSRLTIMTRVGPIDPNEYIIRVSGKLILDKYSDFTDTFSSIFTSIIINMVRPNDTIRTIANLEIGYSKGVNDASYVMDTGFTPLTNSSFLPQDNDTQITIHRLDTYFIEIDKSYSRGTAEISTSLGGGTKNLLIPANQYIDFDENSLFYIGITADNTSDIFQPNLKFNSIITQLEVCELGAGFING